MPKASRNSVIQFGSRLHNTRTHPYSKQELAEPLYHTCQICHQSIKLSIGKIIYNKIQDLVFHYSTCFYELDLYKDIIDPGKANKNSKGYPKDWAGSTFRYKCTSCTSSRRLMGFKEYSIHVAGHHYQVELAMERSGNAFLESGVLQAVKAYRLARDGGEIKDVVPEVFHNCQKCKKKTMSTKKEKLHTLKYHYAECYATEVYFGMYPPGEENWNLKTRAPFDLTGSRYVYSCEKCKDKDLSYRTFAFHNAVQHGGLLEIMSQDSDIDKETLRLVSE